LQKFSKIVVGTHVFVPRAEVEDERQLKDVLTVERKYNGERVKLYKLTKSWVGVPLYHFRNFEQKADKVIDRRSYGYDAEIRFVKKLRPGQEELLKKFKTLKASGGRGFLLNALPGFGKTVSILSMLAELKRTTLVVVPRSNLVTQWVSRIKQYTDLTDKDIGVAMADKCSYRGKKIVVGLVHSLALDRFGDDFKKYFGCIVLDEVDRSVPPQTFAPVVQMFPSAFRFGCSATFKRQDGAEIVFYKHIGQYFLKGKDEGRMAAKVLMYQFDSTSGSVWSKSQTLNRRGMLLSRLASNPIRNKVVRRFIELIVASGRRVIVLSDRAVQLVLLREMLLKEAERNKLTRDDIGFYVRRLPLITQNIRTNDKIKFEEVTQSQRDLVAKKCKVILATYGMMAIGTDIPDVAGLVYATPQSETEQSRGRIERMVKGKKEPIVVDIVDRFYPDSVRWAKKREQGYREKGITIKYLHGGV